MEDWKRTFVHKLRDAQSHWNKRFEEALDSYVGPAYDDVAEFLRNHDISCSRPLNEEGRRSFKFELAENAYLLMIFRSTGLGTFELRQETFVPGSEPNFDKKDYRVADITQDWAGARFERALDAFVEKLGGNAPAESESLEELLAI